MGIRPLKRLASLLVLVACVAGTVLTWTVSHARAEEVQVRAATHDQFGRLMFFWDSPVGFEADATGGRLVVSFDRPMETSFEPVVRTLGSYVITAQPSEDGLSVAFPLRKKVAIRSYTAENAVIVDLLEQPNDQEVAETAPSPRISPVTAPSPLRLRTGEHSGFSRMVFDWPSHVEYGIQKSGKEVVIFFDRPAKIGLNRIQRLQYVEGASANLADGRLTITLTVPEAAQIRHFRLGPKVAIDVIAANVRVPTVKGAEFATATTTVPPIALTASPKSNEPARTPKSTSSPEPRSTAKPAVVPESSPATEPTPLVAGDKEDAQSSEPAPKIAADGQTEGTADKQAEDEQAQPNQTAPQETEETQETISSTQQPETPELRFDWSEPVAAAVFRRAGYLWVVFDSQASEDIEKAVAGSGNTIGTIEQLPSERATVLRLTTPNELNPSLTRDGLSWILRFAEQPLVPEDFIESRVETDDAGGVRLFLPVPEPGDPIAITDPEVGDNLVVVPVIPLGHGVPRTYIYPQVRLLATAQGVVIQPLIDNLRVRSMREGVEISTEGNLRVTPVPEAIRAGARVGSSTDLTRLIALDAWQDQDSSGFTEQRRYLEHAVVEADQGNREQRRKELANFFLAHAYAAECLGMLTLMAEERPEVENEAEFRIMRGASQLFLGRFAEARQDLFHETLDGSDEGAMWRIVLDAAAHRFSNAAFDLERMVSISRTYPESLRLPLNMWLAEAAIAAGDATQASHLLDMLRAEVTRPYQQSRLEYLDGQLLKAIGDFPGAIEKWERVAHGFDRESRARAAFARTELLLKTEQISLAEAIDSFESLRFSWRGGDFEKQLLRRLAQLYYEETDYFAGLRMLRLVAGNFPEDPATSEIARQMSDTFEKLYLEGHADALPPVTAIALFNEFQELTPAGDKGNEMIQKLADRLVEVDLLGEAAELLEQQVNFRLTGPEKAKVGARLALVHMLDRNPQAALAAIEKSAEKGLSKELQQQRRHLAAQALTELRRSDQALALLNDEKDLDAELIRSEIYWKNQDWKNASEVLSRVVRAIGKKNDEGIAAEHRQLVLNLAVALTLAGDAKGLVQVREEFGTAMEASPLRDAFHLIAGPTDSISLDRRDWASTVKDAENFQGYLAAYRERLDRQSLSAIN